MASLTVSAGRANNNALLAAFAALSGLGLYTMRILPAMNNLPVGFMDVSKTGVLPNGVPLKKDFTGIRHLDEGLAFLVSAFVYGPTRWNETFYWQQIHFLLQITVLIAIMNVEACRERNQRSWLKYTAIWAFIYQNIGGAVIIPIWWLLCHRISGPKSYFQTGRTVPLYYARVILPSTVLLFVVPTISLFIPGIDLSTLQNLLAFWQFTPVFVNIPLWLAPYLSSSSKTIRSAKADLAHLRFLYVSLIVLSIGTHWYAVRGISISTSPSVSWASVFVPSNYTRAKSFDWGLLWIFQWDWVFCGLMMVIPAWVAVCDVKRLEQGHVTSENYMEGFIFVLMVTIGGGPGAALAAVWFWREGKLAEIEARNEGGAKKVQ